MSTPLPLTQHSSTDHNALVVILDNVYFFPLSWRKFILDCCRIQAPSFHNKHVQSLISEVTPKTLLYGYDVGRFSLVYEADFYDLVTPLDTIIASTIACGLLSFLVRAEAAHFLSEFQDQRSISFQKEFDAAIDARSIGQLLNYTGLFADSGARIHPHQTGRISPRLSRQYLMRLQSYKIHCRTDGPIETLFVRSS